MWGLTLGYSMRGPVFFFSVGQWGGRIFSLFLFGGVVMPLGQAKNSDINTFGNRSSMQPMKGSASWTHEGSDPFSFWEGRGRNLLPISPCSHHSPHMFPSVFSSSQVVPQSFLIACHFLPQYGLPKIQL